MVPKVPCCQPRARGTQFLCLCTGESVTQQFPKVDIPDRGQVQLAMSLLGTHSIAVVIPQLNLSWWSQGRG